MPNPILTSYANVSAGRVTGLSQSTTAEQARQLLRDIRANLVKDEGKVSSGYLSINRKSDGGSTMETRGRHAWGSWHSDKKDAKDFIRDLIERGYGDELSKESLGNLNKELTEYLEKTGGRFGTKSFVNLVDKLEGDLDLDKDKKEVPDKVNKDNKTRFKADFKIYHSKCSEAAKKAFNYIRPLVEEDTLKHFSNLLRPPTEIKAANSVQAVSRPTQVVGDADGSICRTILAGINAGYISLPEDQLKELAELMNEEAKAEAARDKRMAFQQKPDIAAKFDNIVSKASFQKGHSKLVFLGDILHDRFSNNKQAMATLIRGLHGQGAVFITGNHDVYSEVDESNYYQGDFESGLKNYTVLLIKSKREEAEKSGKVYDEDAESADRETAKALFGLEKEFNDIKLQNGFYGAKQLTKAESDALVTKCFKNAYLDEENAMLYTHNGFLNAGVSNFEASEPSAQAQNAPLLTGKGDYYLTAFGILKAENAEDLVKKLNQCGFDKPRGRGDYAKELDKKGTDALLDKIQKSPNSKTIQKGKEIKFVAKDGTINKTNFRPQDKDMSTEKLGAAGKTRDGRAVKVVHGHEANQGESKAGDVINLNARAGGGRIVPATKVFL